MVQIALVRATDTLRVVDVFIDFDEEHTLELHVESGIRPTEEPLNGLFDEHLLRICVFRASINLAMPGLMAAYPGL